MEAFDSYPELNVLTEGACDHIASHTSFDLNVQGWFSNDSITTDPLKWYCLDCMEEIHEREDAEEHASSHPYF